MPHKSPERTTVAVLRMRLRLTQKEFYPLSMSESEIWETESGRRLIDPDLAAWISLKTGCPAGWILAGDPQAPIPPLDKEAAGRDTSVAEARRGMEALGQLKTEYARRVRQTTGADIKACLDGSVVDLPTGSAKAQLSAKAEPLASESAEK